MRCFLFVWHFCVNELCFHRLPAVGVMANDCSSSCLCSLCQSQVVCCCCKYWFSVSVSLLVLIFTNILVWLAQNRSISSKICLENSHKIGHFFPDCFLVKFAPKTPKKFLWNWLIFPRICPTKIPQNLTFSLAIYQKPWHSQVTVHCYPVTS